MRITLILAVLMCSHVSLAWNLIPNSMRYGVSAALGVWVSYKLQRMPLLRVEYTHTPNTSHDDTVQVTLKPYQYTPSEPHTCNRMWAAFTGIAIHFIVDSLVRNFLIVQNPSFVAYLIGKDSCLLSRMIYYAPFIADRAVSDSFFYDMGALIESAPSLMDQLPYPDGCTYCH